MKIRKKGRITIKKPKALLVEGPDDRYFFMALFKHLGIEDVCAYEYEGVGELRKRLKSFKAARGYHTIVSLAVIRDADKNAKGAFQSVSDALSANELSVPEKNMLFEGESPKVGVFIFPGTEDSGMLETLCLKAVKDKPEFECLDGYFDCIKKKTGASPSNMDKAKIQAFLASQPESGLLLGQAASKGYFPWDNGAFSEIIHFVQSM